MNTTTAETRQMALAKYLECAIDDLREGYSEEILTLGNKEYLVLTDNEADEKVTEEIKNSLWAFNASFILSECGLDLSGEESLKQMQERNCEDANDFILSLVEKCCGLDKFVEAAISADGRGHYLDQYSGNENEVVLNNETFYIYRIN